MSTLAVFSIGGQRQRPIMAEGIEQGSTRTGAVERKDRNPMIHMEPTFTPLPTSVPTWREKVVIKLLLLVARMVALDSDLQTEIKHLATEIGVAREGRA